QTWITDCSKPFACSIEPRELRQIGGQVHERAVRRHGHGDKCQSAPDPHALGKRSCFARKFESRAIEFLGHQCSGTLPEEVPVPVRTRSIEGACFCFDEPDALVWLVE